MIPFELQQLWVFVCYMHNLWITLTISFLLYSNYCHNSPKLHHSLLVNVIILLIFRTWSVSPGPTADCSVAHGHNNNSNNRGPGDHVQTGLHVWDSNGPRNCPHPFSHFEHEDLCQPPPEGNESTQRILPDDLQADRVDLGTLRDSSPRAVHGDLLCALPRT